MNNNNNNNDSNNNNNNNNIMFSPPPGTLAGCQAAARRQSEGYEIWRIQGLVSHGFLSSRYNIICYSISYDSIE